MRTLARCSAVLMLWLMTVHGLRAQASAAATSLQAQVEAIAAQHHGDVAVFARNLKTGETVALAPDVPVQTASTIKLAILYEALERVRAGTLHFDDKIIMQKSDQVPGSGVLLFFDAPLALSFKDVLTMMIVMSDNSAANMAMDHVGIEKVNAQLAKLGLKDTYLYKKAFTPSPAGTVLPPDQKKFGLGKTTAREMTALMTKIATCDLGGPVQTGDAALCAVAWKMLRAQFYRNSIPRYLDGMAGATDSILNKTGSLDASRVDVAAVSTSNGMVVLSCFTFHNQDHSWGAEQEGELTIAKIARAIITAWSPAGLARWPVLVAATAKP